MATPRYLVTKKSYVHDRLVYPDRGEDSEIDFEGVPSRHWKPLNKAAEAEYAKLNDPFTKNKRAIEAAKSEAADKNDGGEGGQGGIDPTTLSPAAKQKMVLDALATMNHKDDAHWTKQGEPDLNVLKEKLGFAIQRGEVKEYAPEFVRQV